MAAATKAGRGRVPGSDTPDGGKTSWAVLDPSGRTIQEVGSGAGPALVRAQDVAQRGYSGPVVLTVERRDLFGPAAPLYRVRRDDQGVIITTVISEED